MRKLTRYLLWAFVFTVPWDTVQLPLVGSVSRAFGLAVVGAAVLTTAIEGRFRKPDAVLGFAITFIVWVALSLLWTSSYENTVVLVTTYVQLVASVWVIRELVRTGEQEQALLVALCFGLFVPLMDLLNNFRVGAGIRPDVSRFTGFGLNADAAGLYLVLGLPIAWQLLMFCRRRMIRGVSLIYVVIAPVGLLLTGTRGAFLAGLIALAIVPLTLRQSLRSYALAGVLLVLGAVFAALLVPGSNWERILSTATEITGGGTMSGRMDIWKAGLQAFPQRPLAGAGAGAYSAAVEPYLDNHFGNNAHNMAFGLLIEEGLVGLSLFAGILGACAWTIFRSPPPHRALFGVLMLTWLVGGMSGDPRRDKLTWVLFGLVSAQSGLRRTVSDVSPTEQTSRRGEERFACLHEDRRAATAVQSA
jgi:O-antigen ligase